MRRGPAPPKEEKIKVPAYIVTFSDMITLLLTFFVLLLSMATEPVEDAKFEAGRQAFIESLNNFGMNGISLGKKATLEVGHPSFTYKVDKNEEYTTEAAPDAEEETIRRVFKELSERMEVTPTQITGKSPSFDTVNVKFKKGSASLNSPAKNYLKNLSSRMQQNLGNESLTIYIVGSAKEEKSLRKQSIVSAKRAQVVADFLRSSLPKGIRWTIYSWGVGPGGQWKSNGPIEESQVIIAVLGN